MHATAATVVPAKLQRQQDVLMILGFNQAVLRSGQGITAAAARTTAAAILACGNRAVAAV
jgi:hypothetical protein